MFCCSVQNQIPPHVTDQHAATVKYDSSYRRHVQIIAAGNETGGVLLSTPLLHSQSLLSDLQVIAVLGWRMGSYISSAVDKVAEQQIERARVDIVPEVSKMQLEAIALV